MPAESFRRTGVIIQKTAETAIVSCLVPERLGIARNTLAISNGFNIAFPEETKEIGLKETISRVGKVSKLLISLNEAADLGISALLRIQNGARQDQILPLMLLKNGLHDDLMQKKKEVDSSFDNAEHAELVTGTLINDFLLLSQNRFDFEPDQYIDFLDLDSGIFEAACIELSFPGLLKKAGIEFPGEKSETTEDLINKYGLYLSRNYLDKKNALPLNKIEKGVLFLHSTEMVLKVRDDGDGVGVDGLLVLPSFYYYAKNKVLRGESESVEKVISEVEESYLNIAEDTGMPRGAMKFIKRLVEITSRLKGNKAFDEAKVYEDSLNIIDLAGVKGKDSALRHRIDGSSLLHELFSK